MKGRPKRTRLRKGGKSAIKLSDADIKEIEAIIGHRFSETANLHRAFTHGSLANGGAATKSYQRLEFLGDRVLNLAIAERVFTRRPSEKEGALAPRLNNLVCKDACADAMRHVGLGRFILMAQNEVEAGGRERTSTLGDVCEALIATIYMDGGLDAAYRFIETAWAPQFATPRDEERDPIMRLQEWAQGKAYGLPKYTVIARNGPDHAPVFTVSVDAGGGYTGEGTGPSKQEARRLAAAGVLTALEG